MVLSIYLARRKHPCLRQQRSARQTADDPSWFLNAHSTIIVSGVLLLDFLVEVLSIYWAQRKHPCLRQHRDLPDRPLTTRHAYLIIHSFDCWCKQQPIEAVNGMHEGSAVCLADPCCQGQGCLRRAQYIVSTVRGTQEAHPHHLNVRIETMTGSAVWRIPAV